MRTGAARRFMALTFECEVVGLELQKELVAGCTELSQRMEAQLQGRATFRQVALPAVLTRHSLDEAAESAGRVARE